MKYTSFPIIAILFISIARSQVNPRSVKIGNQTWMKKNLNLTTYRNGDPMPEVKDSREWTKLTSGAWCYYNNDPANDSIYGKLYNWYAVNDPRGLAPAGWHVPSHEEWTTLSTTLGGEDVAGGKMKETGTIHWLSPNIAATNNSGFTGLPGGSRFSSGGSGSSFDGIGLTAYWWSSSKIGATDAWYRNLYSSISSFNKSFNPLYYGYSVRCIRN